MTSPAGPMIGRIFDRLTVLYRAGADRCRKLLWRCRCRCGALVTVRGSDLVQRKTRSCGCWRSESSRARMRVILAKRELQSVTLA